MIVSEGGVSFHDASLVGIAQDRNLIRLSLEDVSLDDEHCAMIVTVAGVDSFTRDGHQAAGLQMETDDGEVLRLSHEEDALVLTVVWHRHAPQSQDTHTYRLSGEKMSLHTERI